MDYTYMPFGQYGHEWQKILWKQQWFIAQMLAIILFKYIILKNNP